MFLPVLASGLPRDSVVKVFQVMTVERADVDVTGVTLPENLMDAVVAGLRRVVDL